MYGKILAVSLGGLVIGAGVDSLIKGRLVVSSSNSTPTCATASGAGDLCVGDAIEANGALDVAGAATLSGATTQSGDLTLQGGAGALTFSDSASSIVLPDNDATALLVGSTGLLNLVTVDTADGTETVKLTGTTATTTFHVDVGESLFDEGVDMAIAATHLVTIRFCGNGPDGATTTYMGPVLLTDIINATAGEQDPVDTTFGSSLCDGLDNTTEATADRVWHAGYAFKPVAMACVGLCTGASAANDAIVFQLRDDTASVAGMTCTTSALGGDATPAQCTVRDPSPATVAANSALAVSITMTNDDCNDAGDDFECLLYGTF